MPSPFSHLTSAAAQAATPRRQAVITARNPVLWLTLCGAVLVTAILAGTIMMIGQFRERALSNSERELESTVRLVTRHFDQHFEDSDTIAADVIARLQLSEIGSPQLFRARMASPLAHDILSAKAGVLSYLGDISLFDSNGEIVNWSRPLPARALSISARDYFTVFKSDPKSPAILTEAVKSYLNGRLNTVIAHRLTGQNGVFLGVMTRRIDPATYEKFF